MGFATGIFFIGIGHKLARFARMGCLLLLKVNSAEWDMRTGMFAGQSSTEGLTLKSSASTKEKSELRSLIRENKAKVK